MRKLKIAVIGAGSTYSPEMIQGFIDRKEVLDVDSFYMMDIDREKNEIVAGLTKRMLEANDMHPKFVLTEDLGEAVSNADYVLGQILSLIHIFETCLLTDEEKVEVCKVCKEAGADFVKTSTGFSTGGATVEDVALMYKTVAPEVKVKASGGIRNKEDADAMIKAGASRLGTSAGIKIVEG